MELSSNYLELCLIFVGLMLYSNHKYGSNHFLQVLWLIAIPWIGILGMMETGIDSIEYVAYIILMIFNIMLNFFYLSQNISELKNRTKY